MRQNDWRIISLCCTDCSFLTCPLLAGLAGKIIIIKRVDKDHADVMPNMENQSAVRVLAWLLARMLVVSVLCVDLDLSLFASLLLSSSLSLLLLLFSFMKTDRSVEKKRNAANANGKCKKYARSMEMHEARSENNRKLQIMAIRRLIEASTGFYKPTMTNENPEEIRCEKIQQKSAGSAAGSGQQGDKKDEGIKKDTYNKDKRSSKTLTPVQNPTTIKATCAYQSKRIICCHIIAVTFFHFAFSFLNYATGTLSP